MRNIFISPHFDDAIGSCGALIQTLKNVNIITIFTKKYKGQLSNFALQLHKDWGLKDAVKSRRLENKNACKKLNVKCKNLNFLEAIYTKIENDFMVNNFNDLFNKKYIINQNLLVEVYDKIANFVTNNDVLYFPMAFGSHIDHQTIHNVGLRFLKNGYMVKFYSDFSYEVDKMQDFKVSMFFFNEKILRQKIEACMCYCSQMPDLFGNNENAKKYFKNNKKGDWYYEKYYVK